MISFFLRNFYPFELWGEPGHVWLLQIPSILALRLTQSFLLRMVPILIIGASSIEPLITLVAWSKTLQLAQMKTPFWPVETSLITSFEYNCVGGLGLAACRTLASKHLEPNSSKGKTSLFPTNVCLSNKPNICPLKAPFVCLSNSPHVLLLYSSNRPPMCVHNVAIMCWSVQRWSRSK